MRLDDFDYNLPKDLIAQEPVKPRDHSRLLLLEKNTGRIEHKYFYDIIDYFQPGDVLVLNNSKVFPARLLGKKKATGGRIEVFLLHNIGNSAWQCLIGGQKGRVGLEIEFKKKLEGRITRDNQDGTWEVKFKFFGQKKKMSDKGFMEIVAEIGLTPLPPYIKRNKKNRSVRSADILSYQTVYADERKIGSVAAPTAGFHFTPDLLKKLKEKGVQLEYVTLHVGLGTFAPVKEDDITKHKMHAEWAEADQETIARIYLAKHEKRRIIAVGTTSTRILETIASKFPISNFQFPKNNQISKFKYLKQFRNFNQNTDIFIYPGYKFRMVDAMITNFHLPKSTLLMLVSAFAGQKNINKAYREAIKNQYRFYSYGDAMFIY